MKVNSNFLNWIQEASLKDNPAIPGESGEIGKKYLKDVEERAQRKLRDLSTRLGADIPQFMGLVREVKRMQDPFKDQLQELAKTVIMDMYSDILENTDLSIQFPKEKEIQDMMSDVDPEPPEEMKLKALEDQGIIDKIQKRKIGNNITQGEAKNAKKALNSEISVEGIYGIMGEENGKRYIELLNKITDIADFFDWSIPMEVQKEMWTRDQSGFSGSVKVDWEEEEGEDDEDKQKTIEDILKDIENGSDLDQDKLEDLVENGKTKITAIGTDYAMLLHEAIKGIYQLIFSVTIPEDSEVAEVVVMNTDSFADEIEDLRYGPYIAQDLRDFLNTYSESDTINNFREYVFGYILSEENFSDSDFLKLINDILLGLPYLLDQNAQLDPRFADQIRMAAGRAKSAMDKVAKEVSQMIGDYERSVAGMESPAGVEMPGRATDTEVDTQSKEDLMRAIDAALDKNDFAEAKRLSDILNKLS